MFQTEGTAHAKYGGKREGGTGGSQSFPVMGVRLGWGAGAGMRLSRAWIVERFGCQE